VLKGLTPRLFCLQACSPIFPSVRHPNPKINKEFIGSMAYYIMGVGQFMAKEFIKEIGNRSREFYEFVMPPVDVYEEGSELIIVIDLPGFQKKDIHLSIYKDVLFIKAKRTVEELDFTTIHYRQRPMHVEKRIPLPISITDDENINSKATYVNGVVTLKIPLPHTRNISIS
jgi:HSP20 family protein